VLESLVADAPAWAGDDSPYWLLAQVCREQKDTAAERRVLTNSAERADDALHTYRRLIELAVAAGDTTDVELNVERYLAVQPLKEFAYRQAAANADRGGKLEPAIAAARALVALEPADRAGAHYTLARLLHAAGSPEAKRHVLMALEETPRFRDAQRLLLKMVDTQEPKP
jgi:tetratricopeptide (TPR) repeat protein